MKVIFVQILPLIFTHYIPAMICYCWFWLPVTCIAGLMIFGCAWCIADHEENKTAQCFVWCCCGFLGSSEVWDEYGYWEGKYSDEDVSVRDLSKWPLVNLVVVVGIILIPGLSQCYLYSGEYSYIDAIGTVFTERKTQLYWENLTDFTSWARL